MYQKTYFISNIYKNNGNLQLKQIRRYRVHTTPERFTNIDHSLLLEIRQVFDGYNIMAKSME